MDPATQTPEDSAAHIVDELYKFRDRYFESHPIEAAKQRPDDVAQAMVKVVAQLTPLLEANKGNAKLNYLKGKALNVTDSFSKEAEDCLAKAVKLDPNLTDAWNTLGECYWKKGEVENSKNCFTGALAQKKNKVSLRNLSIVLRQQPQRDASAHIGAILASVERAKEAVALDVTDGESWFILGNAYLAQYFVAMSSPEPLLQAMKAYQRADLDVGQSKNNPDLYYNRAQVLKYLEDYQGALAGFAKAAQLDPANPLPRDQIVATETHCERVREAIESRGKVKPKRLNAILATLQKDSAPTAVATLSPGPNNKTSIHSNVLSVLTSEDIPQAFLCVDAVGTCFSLTVYNMVKDGIKAGDDVVIRAPMASRIQVQTSKGALSYPSIRVDDPAALVVNGTALGTNKTAKLTLVATAKAE